MLIFLNVHTGRVHSRQACAKRGYGNGVLMKRVTPALLERYLSTKYAACERCMPNH